MVTSAHVMKGYGEFGLHYEWSGELGENPVSLPRLSVSSEVNSLQVNMSAMLLDNDRFDFDFDDFL